MLRAPRPQVGKHRHQRRARLVFRTKRHAPPPLSEKSNRLELEMFLHPELESLQNSKPNSLNPKL